MNDSMLINNPINRFLYYSPCRNNVLVKIYPLERLLLRCYCYRIQANNNKTETGTNCEKKKKYSEVAQPARAFYIFERFVATPCKMTTGEIRKLSFFWRGNHD